jgi:hypothetical protein
MEANGLGHRAAEVAGQPAIAHILMPRIDVDVRNDPGPFVQQVADVVEQGGDDERVGRVGPLAQQPAAHVPTG